MHVGPWSEASARYRTEAARLAREVLAALEATAEKETGELEESAATAVKVATLRMKATKKAAAAMAKAAAAEGAGGRNPRPAATATAAASAAAPLRAQAAQPTRASGPETNPFMMDEPYIPEGGAGGSDDDAEYVPMTLPEDESAGTIMDVGTDEMMEAFLAQGPGGV